MACFRFYDQTETSSGLGLADCGEGVLGDYEYPERGIEVEGKCTEISVGIIVRNGGTPAYFHFDPFRLTRSTAKMSVGASSTHELQWANEA